MALPGYYKINYTDPRKGSFIIEPYQTDGPINPTSSSAHSAARRISTSLLLYGRDVPSYGERIAENFVQLLENFAGGKAPVSPIEGQLWFDTGSVYEIAAWTNGITLTLAGDVVADFLKYAASSKILTLAYSPLNAVADNSHRLVNVIPKTAALVNGNTVVTFASQDNDGIELPSAVVGGFIVCDNGHYSRMRVAAKVGGDIKWVDVTNVYSAEDAPEVRHRMVGDLWYDTASNQLNVFGTGGWASVAAKYLPLSGGTMTGDLQMGDRRVYSSSTISSTQVGDANALVNRKYVDVVQSGIQTQIDTLNTQMGAVQGTDLKGKVSKSGDEMTGALIFGLGNSTTSINRGIDLNNYPMVRPLITWNSNDYLSAALQTNYAVDKLYVAKALAQHLADEVHGTGGFIEVQADGTGVFPASVAFNAVGGGKTYSLSWYDLSGNNKHSIYAQYSGMKSQLIIEAGSDSSDTIDFRHTAQVTGAEALFSLGLGFTTSGQTIYIHDGQPQPKFTGAANANNDDTAASTKGFVRKYVTDNMPAQQTPGTSVTGLSYAYNIASQSYTLTLTQSDDTTVSVNQYHKHAAADVSYTYTALSGLDWADTDPIAAKIAIDNADYPNLNVTSMLNAMNKYKAPVTDAIFTNLPRVGVDAQVMEYNAASKTIRVYGNFSTTMKVGAKIVLDGSAANDGTYTVTAVAAGAISNNKFTTVITVAEALSSTGVETNTSAYVEQGLYTDATNPRDLVTRTTLDYEISQATGVSYLYFKATTAGTNVVKALGFTYKPGSNRLWVFRNGQKLRVNTLTGGDFNETSATSITIASVAVNEEYEIYLI